MRVLLLTFILTLPSYALAGLGDQESSVEHDRQALGSLTSGKLVRSGANFTVQEIVVHGNTIHEYVNAQGVIFAIAWHGLRDPDLSILLGKHFQDYSAALQSHQRIPGRRPLALTTPSITVLKSGHLRSFHGKAYVTDLLPASGLSIGDLQ